MEKKINNILFITKSDGTKLTFKVLFTYHSDTFNKDYAAFYNVDDENHLICFTYDEEYNLNPVKSEAEFSELNKILQQYDQEQALKNKEQN